MNRILRICLVSALLSHAVGAMQNNLISQLNQLNNVLKKVATALGSQPGKDLGPAPSAEQTVNQYSVYVAWGEPLNTILREVRNNAQHEINKTDLRVAIKPFTAIQLGTWSNVSPEDQARIETALSIVFQHQQPFIQIEKLEHIKTAHGAPYESLKYKTEIRSKKLSQIELQKMLESKIENLKPTFKLQNDFSIFEQTTNIPDLQLAPIAQKFNALNQNQKKAPILSVYIQKDGLTKEIWSRSQRTNAGLTGWVKSWFSSKQPSEETAIIPPAPPLEKYKEWEERLREKEKEVTEDLEKAAAALQLEEQILKEQEAASAGNLPAPEEPEKIESAKEPAQLILKTPRKKVSINAEPPSSLIYDIRKNMLPWFSKNGLKLSASKEMHFGELLVKPTADIKHLASALETLENNLLINIAQVTFEAPRSLKIYFEPNIDPSTMSIDESKHTEQEVLLALQLINNMQQKELPSLTIEIKPEPTIEIPDFNDQVDKDKKYVITDFIIVQYK